MNAADLLPVVLLGGLLGLDVVSFPQAMVSRPLVAATVAGWLAGNATAGLLIGATLELIAQASGGAVFDLDRADTVAGTFKVKRVARVLEDRQEIWHAPLVFGIVLAAIFAEWLLRKRYRLI